MMTMIKTHHCDSIIEDHRIKVRVPMIYSARGWVVCPPGGGAGVPGGYTCRVVGGTGGEKKVENPLMSRNGRISVKLNRCMIST